MKKTRNMRRMLSIVLMVALVSALLIGCGGDQQTKASDTFKIGGTGPTTGGNAYYGNEVKNGMQIAVDEINAAGGIAGKQIEMNFQDDEADPEKAVNAYNALKDWGMHVIVGATTSDACIALGAETANDGVFQITPSGSAVDCVANPNVFQVCFSDPNQGTASAKYISENQLATKVAVIYDSSSSYSSGVYEGFASVAKQYQIEIVAAEAFTADNNTDFSVQLQTAKAKGADLVFLPIYYQQACIILKQAADMQYAPKFFACDGLDGILGVEGFDTSLAEGTMYLTPYVADDMSEATKTFTDKYVEVYGMAPSQFAADAYDAVYVVKAAAEEAGVTVDMSASEVGEAMIQAMTTIEVEGVTSVEGTPMKWDENGMVDKEPKAAVIKDGEYKSM